MASLRSEGLGQGKSKKGDDNSLFAPLTQLKRIKASGDLASSVSTYQPIIILVNGLGFIIVSIGGWVWVDRPSSAINK